MRCILNGHEPQPYPGQGQHAGKTFAVCIHCGATFTEAGERVSIDATYGRAPGMMAQSILDQIARQQRATPGARSTDDDVAMVAEIHLEEEGRL